MSDTVSSLLRDMLAWIDARPRTYAEVMEAWRTSCPRLPVWEEATDRGLVEHATAEGQMVIRLTRAGEAFLREQG